MINGYKRSHYCGLISEEDIGQRSTVMGWVQRIRDMGGIIFLDLRDKTGILQVVCDVQNIGEDNFPIVEKIRNEYVVAMEGLIEHRDEETYNPNIPTGTIELRAENLEILSQAKLHPSL